MQHRYVSRGLAAVGLLAAGLAAMPILVASLEAWPIGLGVGVLLGLGATMLVHGRAPAARPSPRQPG